MRLTSILIFIILFPINVFSQTFNDAKLKKTPKNWELENESWYNGKIKLYDGKTIEGNLNYNFVTEVLNYDHGDIKGSVVPEQVVYFQIIDENDDTRLFYSLPILKNGQERWHFLQKIYEKNGVGIFSHHGLELQTYEEFTAMSEVMNRRVVENVMETIYLVSSTNGIIEFGNRKKEGIFYYGLVNVEVKRVGTTILEHKNDRNMKIKDADLIFSVLPQHRDKIKSYIKSEKLNLRILNDLIKVFAYYNTW